jgi:pimeloyl-ACP methyl ester carboxylesterase
MERSGTKYARSGEYHIAYQVLGAGPADLVYIPGWVSHLDLYREEPSVVRFFDKLASSFRLIVFDKRGIGLSDAVSPNAMPTLEERMDDVRAVLDAVGSERAVVVGQGYGCPIAVLFAAAHPERVEALVLYSPVAKTGLRTEDYPWGSTPDDQDGWRQRMEAWGTDEFAAAWVARMAPTAVGDRRFVDWAARVMRASASPAAARSFTEMNATMDVRAVLGSIHVPTLVLVREDVSAPKGAVDVRSRRSDVDRGADPERDAGGGAGTRLPPMGRRPGEHRPRGGQVLHGRRTLLRARAGAAHGVVHGHRRLHRAGHQGR